MLTQAEKSMKDHEWIAFLGWTPHPVMGEMKIAYLDGMGNSGFGAATVHTNVRNGYVTECPNAPARNRPRRWLRVNMIQIPCCRAVTA